MSGMSGKASGRTQSVPGIVGRFTLSDRGRATAIIWRDEQATPFTAEWWAIVERGGHVWCLPPAEAARAEREPDWTPEFPFDLEPMETKRRMIAEAAAAGLPAPGYVPLCLR